jgi:hypothetical protein
MLASMATDVDVVETLAGAEARYAALLQAWDARVEQHRQLEATRQSEALSLEVLRPALECPAPQKPIYPQRK